MKKCLALLLVLLSLLSAASAEAPARANNAAVQAMLEATLANGAGIRKDPLAMLENAWRNGFDYFEVSCDEESGLFRIRMGIQGFQSAVTSIVNGGGEEAAHLLEALEANVLSKCQSIREMLAMVGREDIHFIFYLIEDETYYECGMKDFSNITVFCSQEGHSFHSTWKLSDQQQEP